MWMEKPEIVAGSEGNVKIRTKDVHEVEETNNYRRLGMRAEKQQIKHWVVPFQFSCSFRSLKRCNIHSDDPVRDKRK